jgi:two-component system response regulator VanR
MRLLIAEDDEPLADVLADALRRKAMAVDVVHDGPSALEAVATSAYDVLLLDRDLPGRHGDDVAREISERGGGPLILMLTAARSTRDTVDGLSVGADDYLAKPFHLDELVARLWALNRRAVSARPPVLRAGGLALDPFRHVVTHNDTALELTRKEFAVLQVLMAAGGGVISAETLLEKAWDENANPFTNSIRMTISTLRRKLPTDAIQTIPGVGYRIRS